MWLLSGGQVATGMPAWWMQTSAPTGHLRGRGSVHRTKVCPGQVVALLRPADSTVPPGLSGSLAVWSSIAPGVSLNRGLQFLLLGRHPTSPSEDELCVPVWVEKAGLSWPL